MRCYNQALEMDARNAEAWTALGAAHANLGSLPKAVSCFQKALGECLLVLAWFKAVLMGVEAVSSLSRSEVRCCQGMAISISSCFYQVSHSKSDSQS